VSSEAGATPPLFDAEHKGGALVLVVGPSGAGKDTVMGIARGKLAGDSRIVFARRLVTRVPGAWEDHDTIAETDFHVAVARGDFCLSWTAHGLGYGLPASVRAEADAGRIVVANASRSVVGAARRDIPGVRVVLVTAPREVLERRVAARGRDADVAARIDRLASSFGAGDADLVIVNTEAPELAGGQLSAYLIALASRCGPASRTI